MKTTNQKPNEMSGSYSMNADKNERKALPTFFNLSWTISVFVLTLFIALSSCKKDMDITNPTQIATDEAATESQKTATVSFDNLKTFYLSTDDALYHRADRVDKHLVNAWGMAINPDDKSIWITAEGKGLSVVYNRWGRSLQTPVYIPFQGGTRNSHPTGVVYNNTNDFMMDEGARAKVIFSTENGTIAVWNSGTLATVVVDRSETGAMYKGLAMANNNGTNYLYATDFYGHKVDVFDASFNLVSMRFIDPEMPSGYAPYGIQNIDGKLFVTYAKIGGNLDEENGPGNGYVSVFSAAGEFLNRFASQGVLNSPWGIAKVPGGENKILIGNFGDGRINVFSMDGTFMETLKEAGNDIRIDGLWAIAFAPDSFGFPGERIYFTAGPGNEQHGLFGIIKHQ